jgi:hypothetical protein
VEDRLHLRKVQQTKLSWKVTPDETGYILLAMFLTILTSILSVALPALKGKVAAKLFKKKYNNSTLLIKERDTVISESEEEGDRPESTAEHIFSFIYIFTYSSVHIATMMLIMTFNGYVVIAVMVGLTLGYAIFGMECDKDKNVPVNCCA